MNRKEKFSEWQQIYSKENKDLEEPKQLLNREESRRTLETPIPHIEKDVKVKAEKKRSSTGAKSKYVLFECNFISIC